MADPTTSLLQADEAVRKTLDQLEALKAETRRQIDASQSLSQTRDRLEALILQTGDLARRTGDAISQLVAAGGPEVLAGQRRLESLMVQLSDEGKGIAKATEAARAAATNASERSELAVSAATQAATLGRAASGRAGIAAVAAILAFVLAVAVLALQVPAVRTAVGL